MTTILQNHHNWVFGLQIDDVWRSKFSWGRFRILNDTTSELWCFQVKNHICRFIIFPSYVSKLTITINYFTHFSGSKTLLSLIYKNLKLVSVSLHPLSRSTTSLMFQNVQPQNVQHQNVQPQNNKFKKVQNNRAHQERKMQQRLCFNHYI